MILACQHDLHFVPALFTALGGDTGVEHASRLWELTEWLPGRADFHERPTGTRLEAACIALAQLHSVWRKVPSEAGVCPAVRRRLEFLHDWRRLVSSGWQPLAAAGVSAPLYPLVERAWRLLPSALEEVPRRLQRWADAIRPLQPCLCDVWHDHLLFEGDQLTGLIDYGAVKIDHVAVDLARMLGSLVRDGEAAWRADYRRIAASPH